MKRDHLHFEESIIDGFVEGDHQLEQPLPSGIFIFFACCAVLVVGMTLVRTFFLGVGQADFYQARASANVNQIVVSAAPRGLITDRFGKPLLKNVPSFSVALQVNAFLERPGAVGTIGPEEIDAELNRLAEVIGVDKEELQTRIKNVDFEHSNRIIIARTITLEQAIQVKTLVIPGIQVEDDYRREYLNGPVFSHVIGYTGFGGKGTDVTGVANLEAYYEPFLRGQNGEYMILRDVKGNEIDKKVITEAKAGSQVVTTIDSEFQSYFYDRLRAGLASLGRQAGVGLALDPRTGEVLALVNVPSFDNNDPSKFLKDEAKSLFNRAIAGVYNPGSTIKPLVAMAALKEGAVTPDWQVYSKGYIELPNPFFPDKPSRFLDWRANGWVDIRSALARSSNIFFYAVGGGCSARVCEARPSPSIQGLGIGRLQQYWRQFGIDQPTGIDMGGEAVGTLPDPKQREQRTGQPWRIGDTYNVSIGQGDLAVTPIRLISIISSIADNGKMHRPLLVKKIVDQKGQTIEEHQPEELFDYTDWQQPLAEVQQGMRDAVAQPYGTANLLYDLPYRTAAKTGSAQIQNNTKTNAFFVGYGPYEDPKVAILVLIEDAKEGSINTLPIAHDVMKWYYENRISP